MTTRRIALMVLALAAVLAGCSKSTKVGSSGLLNIKSPPSSPKAVESQVTPTSKARAEASVRSSPTQQRQTPTFDLFIRETQRGFEPQVFRVFVGTKVIFHNLDKNCPQRTSDPGCHHSWVADNGTWNSGRIAAGRTWPYVTRKTGKFRFHDGEVPYNIGEMDVLPAP